MSKWVGYAVSVNCGETLGCYQGTILETDGTTITLTKAFRNGFSYPKSQVTLSAADIKELRIIEPRGGAGASPGAARGGAGASPGAARGGAGASPGAAPARRPRATVCETLQANPTSTGNQVFSNNVSSSSKTSPSRTNQPALNARSEPLQIQASRNKNTNNQSGSYGSGSTPKSRGTGFGGRGESTGIPGPGDGGLSLGGGHEKTRRRDEACFGDAAEPALDDDFDFEGNLALFDKRAVWASMRSSKPDVVRTADESKFRHDENVLGPAGSAAGCALSVPEELRGAFDYVTDEGVTVPSVTPRLRRQLWEGLQRHGLLDFALTMVARAACDVALRLVGGGRRLEARNAHQAPLVVALCGAHRGGVAGLAAGRLLASRGARLHALVHGAAPRLAPLQRELSALQLDNVPLHRSPETLPGAPDLVLVALYDPLAETALEQYGAERRWAAARRAGCVVLEPAGGAGAEVPARACVLGAACVALAPALGRVYLADVAPPAALFAERGLHYRPPFGAAPALPLHPALR